MWLPRVHDYWNNPSILNVVTESWNHLCCSKINKTLYIEPERPGPISISYENIPHTAQRHIQSKAHSKLLPPFLIIRCSSLFPERYASRCILVCIFTHFSQSIMKRLKHLIFRNRGSIYQLRLDQHAHKHKFQIATKCHCPNELVEFHERSNLRMCRHDLELPSGHLLLILHGWRKYWLTKTTSAIMHKQSFHCPFGLAEDENGCSCQPWTRDRIAVDADPN
jgi:hypothetical protein